MAIYRLSNYHPDVAAHIRETSPLGTDNQDSLGQWNDPSQFGSYSEWSSSLTPLQSWWIQHSPYGRQSNIRNQALNLFDLGGDPATRNVRNFTGQLNPLQGRYANSETANAAAPSPQPSPQPGGAGNAGTFNPQPASPYPTQMPTGGGSAAPTPTGPVPVGASGPTPTQGGLFGGQQPYQPQTGLFTPNYDNPGGWEAIMHQQFNQMPHIANPRAPEVTLGGSWLNAGDTMRIPSNLMSNVPGLFGGMNQQTQWGGYWGPELTGMVGPHGIAPGYGYYNSNSPVNYTGLFAQSNPFWGNPVASPAFPTPSPQSLSPFYGSSHWDSYRSNVSMDPNAYRDYINNYVGRQIDDAIQGGFADEIANATDPMTGCLVNDTQCKAQFWMDQGGE